MSSSAVGAPVRYVGGGRFAGNQVFTGLWELRIGDVGVIHAIPGERGDLGCTFGNLKVSLNSGDIQMLTATKKSLEEASSSTRGLSTAALIASKRSRSGTRPKRPLSLAASLSAASVARPNSQTPRSPSQRSKRNTSTPMAYKPPYVSELLQETYCGSLGRHAQSVKKQVKAAMEQRRASTKSLPAPITTASTLDVCEQSAEMEPVMDSERPHPPSFYCPISHQCMHDPVILTDGHTYERRHIEQWLQYNGTSPVSGAKLSQKSIFPNHALRNAIEEYFEQVLGDHREAIKHAVSGLQQRGISSRNTTLVRTIDSLMQCSILVNADLSIEHVLTKIMQEAKSLVGAEVASVFLVDRKRNELYSTVNSTGSELRIPIKSGIAGSVAYSGMPLIIQHAYSDNRFNSKVDTKTGFKTRNIMCVPLKAWKGGIIGVAQLINKTNAGAVGSSDEEEKHGESDERDFTLDDQQFLEVLAAQAGAAIVNSGMFESMPGVSGAGRWPSPPKSRSPTLEKLPSLSKIPTLESIAAMEESEDDEDREETKKNACIVEENIALSPKKMRLVKPLLVAAADNWEMDTLSLAELTDDRPLSTLGMHLFQYHGLTSFFDIDCGKLEHFLLVIESGYPVSNQYHNRAHAASVLHFMHSILSHGGVAQATFMVASASQDRKRQQKLVALAGLLAAIVHDYEHEGVNNDFLIKTASERAIFYNDRSPNENHHVAAAFGILRRPEYNFLENLTVKEYRQLRSLVVDMVLATDMAEHGKNLTKFKDIVGGVDSCPFTEQEALLALQMALKCADLGHLSLSWSSHMRWVQRLEQEFFAQGDKERKEGMPEVSFLMDRNKQGASDTQVGFFDFVVLPLFREFAKAFPAADPMTSAVEENYQKWKNIQTDLAAVA